MPTRPRLLPRLVVVGAAAGLVAAAGAVPAVARAPERTGPPRAGTIATATTGAARATSVVLPVDGPVTRLFVRPAQRWSRGHRGVDLAADPGTPVRSPVSGTVEFAGPVAGRTVLTVLRSDGLRCSLEPLADVVAVGEPVSAGDVIGVLAVTGPTGHCGGEPCVHWGARRDGDYVDPLGLLEPVTTVLLPWP